MDYAQAMSIPPHPDYGPARMLLAGIDTSLCTNTFLFGKEGKPYFINGPLDSPERIKVIMQKVRMAGGETMLRIHEGSRLLKALGMEITEEEEEEEEEEPSWIGSVTE